MGGQTAEQPGPASCQQAGMQRAGHRSPAHRRGREPPQVLLAARPARHRPARVARARPPWRRRRRSRRRCRYPVLVRPSYVLSGSAMAVATSDTELRALPGARGGRLARPPGGDQQVHREREGDRVRRRGAGRRADRPRHLRARGERGRALGRRDAGHCRRSAPTWRRCAGCAPSPARSRPP